MPKIWYNNAKQQYCADIMVDGRRRRVFLGSDRALASRDLQHMYNKATITAYTMSLVELAEKFLGYIKINRRPNTYNFYRHYLSVFVRMHTDKDADSLRPNDLEAIKAGMLESGKSNTTINHLIGMVKCMYKWGNKMGYIDTNPVLHVDKLPKAVSPERVLSYSEECRLLEVCDRDMQEIVITFLRTGLRLSELANMRWGDIDLDRRTITIKGRKNSTTARNPVPLIIPIHEDVYNMLIDKKTAKGLVFPNKNHGAYNKDTLRRRFNKACKRAGISGVTIHTLRHTFATRLLGANESLAKVSRLLGHTTQYTTQRYAHLDVESVRSTISKLPANTVPLVDLLETGGHLNVG